MIELLAIIAILRYREELFGTYLRERDPVEAALEPYAGLELTEEEYQPLPPQKQRPDLRLVKG